jgi:hypothetical protein
MNIPGIPKTSQARRTAVQVWELSASPKPPLQRHASVKILTTELKKFLKLVDHFTISLLVAGGPAEFLRR